MPDLLGEHIFSNIGYYFVDGKIGFPSAGCFLVISSLSLRLSLYGIRSPERDQLRDGISGC